MKKINLLFIKIIKFYYLSLGLDSFMAKNIVYYLKKMSQAGKTIICTIHQPSSETFKIFDKICILSQTRVAYFGPREEALTFFQESLNRTCPPLTNPADFYMVILLSILLIIF